MIESPDNKFVDITLKDGSKGLMYSSCTLMDYTPIYGKALYEDKIYHKTAG